MKIDKFAYSFEFAARVDIGARRKENQDEVICCPTFGFFAVSDGMGGLLCGGDTSKLLAEIVPKVFDEITGNLPEDISPEFASALLRDIIGLICDDISGTKNSGYWSTEYGATVCGVWLVGDHAVFVNLGDSRGYWLGSRKRHLTQITEDHNEAAELVASGELTRDMARFHPTSAYLTRFVGMESPAEPETFMQKVGPGDRLLVCSDGLHGMLEDNEIVKIMRSSGSCESVADRLIDDANKAGGNDNISAVYIKVTEG